MFSCHRFQNCNRLERLVESLNSGTEITLDILEAYHNYHFALIQKLRSADHSLLRLKQVLQDASIGTGNLDNPRELFFLSNMYIDGFFYCGGSAFDILARELLSYFSIPLPRHVYYRTAREQLRVNRPGDPLLVRLEDPAWKQEFSEYRNSLTHELLLADNYTMNYRIVGSKYHTELICPLPDNPRVPIAARTYTRNPDVIAYSEQHFRRLITHINTIYGDLINRIRAHGHLPL